MAINNDEQKSLEKLRHLAVEKLKLENFSPQKALSDQKTEDLFHELRVHQIELEMQNEELKHSRRELELSREKYFKLYDIAPVGYCTLNGTGLVVESNLKVCELFGLDRIYSKRQLFSSFIFKDDLHIYYQAVKNLSKTGDSQTCEVRFIRRNRTSLWVLLDISSMQDADGAILYLVAVSDITRRKQTEIELLESREWYRMLSDQAPVSIMRYDKAGILMDANPACLIMFGVEYIDEFKDFNLFEDSNLSDKDRRKLKHGESVHYQNFFDFEKIKKSKLPSSIKSGVMWTEVIISHFENKYEKISGYLCYITDITERKKAEEEIAQSNDKRARKELLESEERYNLAIEGTGAGLWDWDMTSDKIAYSPRFKKMLGYAESEVENTFLGWKNLWHPDDCTFIEKTINDYIAGKIKKYEIINRLRHKDGSWRWIVSRGAITRDLEGKPVRWVGTSIDITDHHEMEIEILQKNEQLKNEIVYSKEMAARAQEANNAKILFLTNMSHEIITPINAILGFTQIALKSSMTSKQNDYMVKINTSAEKLLSLFNGILELSKMEAGSIKADKIFFQLGDLLAEPIRQFRIMSVNKGLGLILSIAEDVPTKLSGDPAALLQILSGFIDNAIKFTEKGRVLVDIKLIENLSDRVLLQFSVADTGIGMTQKQIKDLLGRFYQAEESSIRKYSGTGLGITLARKLAELSGGEIRVESKFGSGSTFFFTSFFDKSASSELEFEHNSSPLFTGPDIETLELLRGTRILLVEDNEINKEIMLELLKGANMKVSIAGNGVEAVERIKTDKYDAVLMDILMPDMDGFMAATLIRKIPGAEAIPIIALTASAITDNPIKYIEAGMNGFLTKPVDTGKLFHTLAQLIKKKQNDMTEKGEAAKTYLFTGADKKITGETDMSACLKGIDVKTGTDRLLGNQKLFYSLLIKFSENQKYVVAHIQQAMDTDDFKTAEMLAHSLRGAAGNLGAMQISALAARLEAEIKTGKSAIAEALIEELGFNLNRTFASIKLLKISEDEETAQSDLIPINLFELKPLIDALAKSLRNYDVSAIERLEEFTALKYKTNFGEKIDEIKKFAYNYDFEKALKILDGINLATEEVYNGNC